MAVYARRCSVIVLSMTAMAAGAQPQHAPPGDRDLVHLVRDDCGSCHGLTLKGGLGPSLLPDALRGKSAAYLASVILEGRPDTAMPPFSPILTRAQAEWIAQHLLAGFPDAR